MDFDSLDDIIKRFDFDVKNADEIKKELKSLIKEVHPDKNRGDFKSETDKNSFYEIQAALEYLEKMNPNVSLSTQSEITALTKVLTDLAVTKRKNRWLKVWKRKVLH